MTHNEIDALLLAAEEENKLGNFANAEKLAREVIEHAEKDKTSAGETLQIRALLTLSISLWRRGMAKEALPFAELALAESMRSISPEIRTLKATALIEIGNVYVNLSEYTKSLEYFENALELYEELGNKAGLAASLGNIGMINTALSEYAKALEYFEKALALDEQLGNKDGAARHTHNIGDVYRLLSQYGIALEYEEKALAVFEQLGNKGGLEMTTGSIGVVYMNLSQYAKAFEYIEMALALDEELGNKSGMARHTACIGDLYYEISEYAKALEYFEKALALDEERGNNLGVAVHTGNIGEIYCKLSQYAKALVYYEKALNMSLDIGAKQPAGYWLRGIGSSLLGLGRNEEAMEYLQRSLHLRREEIESNEGVADTLISISRLLAEQKQFAEAIEKLDEGLALAEQLGEKKVASDAHKELAAIYKKLGDTAKTLEHTEKHYALKEEIFSDDTRKRVEAFNFRVATANKERDLKLAQQEAKVALLEKEQAVQSLRLKERDLANTASSLAAQTELLGDFRADLRKIVMRPDKYEPEDVIRQVKAKLKELPCEMIDFGKFEAQFATVHPEFRARLETKFPDLTPQEIKISMLIHVNLQNAAIARLTCLSERSVEGHRLNIRKKLALTKEQNLAEVLRTLDKAQ